MLAIVLCLAAVVAADVASLETQVQSKSAPEKKREVTGVVVDSAGKPLPRAALFFIGVDADGEPGFVRYDPDGFTDAEGRFSLPVEGVFIQSGLQLSIGVKRPADKEVKTLRSPTGDFPRIDAWNIPAGNSLDLGQLTPPPERKRIRQAEGKLVEIYMVQSANVAFTSKAGPARATPTGKPQRMFIVLVGDREFGGKCAFGSQNPYRPDQWREGDDVSIRFDAKGTRFWLTNRKGQSTPPCQVSFEEKARKPGTPR